MGSKKVLWSSTSTGARAAKTRWQEKECWMPFIETCGHKRWTGHWAPQFSHLQRFGIGGSFEMMKKRLVELCNAAHSCWCNFGSSMSQRASIFSTQNDRSSVCRLLNGAGLRHIVLLHLFRKERRCSYEEFLGLHDDSPNLADREETEQYLSLPLKRLPLIELGDVLGSGFFGRVWSCAGPAGSFAAKAPRVDCVRCVVAWDSALDLRLAQKTARSTKPQRDIAQATALPTTHSAPKWYLRWKYL